MSQRWISHSEASSLLDCQLAWDFAYGGWAAGTALVPRTTLPLLRDGRAWGQAVAAWHQYPDDPQKAHAALAFSLAMDGEEQQEAGCYDSISHIETQDRLTAILGHYMETATPIPLRDPEFGMLVSIPSRTGKQRSTRFRYEAYLDGLTDDEQDGTWLVEFKLRTHLSDFSQVAMSRQIRWYAWAYREATGTEPVGVIVDERLNRAPDPVNWLVSGKPSHDKRQMCRAADYERACEEAGVNPSPDALEAFRARRWQARHSVLFRPGELVEAGEQLVSIARQIALFDSGELFPIRNPSRARCPGCRFQPICSDPADGPVVDALYHRVPPKREREVTE